MTQIIKPQPEATTVVFASASRIIVLVEGKDDVAVFKKLYFDRLSDIAFQAVDGDKNFGGELDLLKSEKPVGKVFGIRDRDFRSDEEVALSLSASDSIVFTLGRYCIENYLLEPAAVLRVLDDALNEERPWSSIEEVEAFLLELCSDLCLIMAANWVLYEANVYAPYFGFGDERDDRAELADEVARHTGKLKSEALALIAEKEAIIAETLHSVDAAYTRINGKHLLHRLHRALANIKMGVNRKPFFNLLLAQIKQQDLIHADLREIVEQKILGGS